MAPLPTAPMLSLLFASSFAILLVLLLMPTLRRRLGAELALAAWLAVPLSGLLAFWPMPAAESWRWSVPAVLPVVASLAPGEGAALAAAATQASLGAFWALGSAAFAALLVVQQRRFRRRLDLCDRGERHGDLVVLRARSGGGPLLLGAWRPTIVLPADFERRHPPAERALILAHEAMHARRRDGLWSAVAAGLRCLFWFNPLVHVAAARFRRDQELACDAAVLRAHPDAKRGYAEAVLHTQLLPRSLPVGCHWQSHHPVKERILMIANASLTAPRRTHKLGLALAIAALVGTATLASPTTRAGTDAADAAPSYARLSPPVYPKALAEQRVEGTVLLRVAVGADGKPGDIDLDPASPALPAALNEAAIAAVRTWTFNPATKDGQPVPSQVVVPVKFALDPAAETATDAPAGALDAIQVGPAS